MKALQCFWNPERSGDADAGILRHMDSLRNLLLGGLQPIYAAPCLSARRDRPPRGVRPPEAKGPGAHDAPHPCPL